MKFVVDAQLPLKLAVWLNSAGHDAIHTSELTGGNRLDDIRIIEFAEIETRIVISKDKDFVDSHLLLGQPAKLLYVSTGNILNRQLESIIMPNPSAIGREFLSHDFLEIDNTGLSIRG